MAANVPCAAWPMVLRCKVDTDDDGLVASAKMAATWVLWSRSGRVYDVCDVQLRPCTRRGCMEVARMPGWLDACGHYSCGCGTVGGLRLDRWVEPVASVESVVVDGVELEEADWRVEAGVLYRTDGTGWPATQHMHLAATEEGTWAVNVKAGLAPDPMGLLAVAELACQILLGLQNKPECTLPSNLISVARTGVAQGFASPDVLDESVGIGLKLCDQWLRALKAERGSRLSVLSPDFP